MDRENAKNWIIFIVALAFGCALTLTFFIVGDNLKEKEASIYFNATMYGRDMTIRAIQQEILMSGLNANIPLFDSNNNLTYIKLGDICTQLNTTGG